MNVLVLFAQNRHRLTKEEQLIGDKWMLETERKMWINVWALDVLTLAYLGKFAEVVTLLLTGPREVHMSDSVNVSYARLRHDAAPVEQQLSDRLFMTIQRMDAGKLRMVETMSRALVAKWGAWWAQLTPPLDDRRSHA